MHKFGGSTLTATKIENILETMEYNEEQSEDVSSILNWICQRNDKIESIVGGSTVKSGTNASRDLFRFADKTVSVCYLDESKLKHILESDEYANVESSDKKSAPNEQEKQQRIAKFKKLVANASGDLCAAESVATIIPQWQVKEFDQPTWQHQISLEPGTTSYAELTSAESGKTKILFVQLSREGYSMEKLLPLFAEIAASDERFVLVMSSCTCQDSSTLLPVAYLVDAMNAANIRKWPIDILFLDRSMERAIVSFLQSSKKVDASQVYLWDDFKLNNKFPCQLVSGVGDPGAVGGARAHFILDAMADAHMALDSIVAAIWSSGVRVNHRARCVLFIQQPFYTLATKYLKKKISEFKVTEDVRLESNDFVKRPAYAEEEINKIMREGVKIFPVGSDFSIPTLLYNIGTSCDIMASSAPRLGHVLFVVSYRSTAELLSLANNYGDDNEVFIHGKAWDTLKEVVTGIKGANVRVETHNRQDLLFPPSLSGNKVIYKLSPSTQSPRDESQLTKAEIDEFERSALLAEKALKAWTVFGTEKRRSLVFEACKSAMKQWMSEADQQISLLDTDEFRLLSELGGFARVYNNQDEKEFLVFNECKPQGVVAILFTDPAFMSFETILIPIMLTLAKGNTVIVVSTADSFPFSLICSFILNSLGSRLPECKFPAGSLQFVPSPNISHSIELIGHPGKVSLLWVITSGGKGPQMNEALFTSFRKVIVSPAAAFEKCIVKYARELERFKISYL